MRVKKSATGSVKFIRSFSFARSLRRSGEEPAASKTRFSFHVSRSCRVPAPVGRETENEKRETALLPGRLTDARNFSAQCQPAEAQAAKAEFAQEAARAAADMTAIPLPYPKFGLLQCLGDM
jgi:hypothetical protein